MHAVSIFTGLALAGLAATGAAADVTISNDATQNMTCAAGVCAPTANNAVLNVTDLENYLAAGNLTISTTGSGVQANNIDVDEGVSWSSSNTLTLDAYQTIDIEAAVSVAGTGGLSIATNDGGSGGAFSIGNPGSVVFQNLSSALSVNGAVYTLVNSVAALAGAIAANPSGDFALANSYDASQDGTYSESPVQTTPFGTVDGLGNTISNLSIQDTSGTLFLGLIGENEALIEHVRMSGLRIEGSTTDENVIGSIAAAGGGFFEDSATGEIYVYAGADVGGLAGDGGSISKSFSDVTIHADGAKKTYIGGLSGYNLGTISDSFAMGSIHAGSSCSAGGLVGMNPSAGGGGNIENSYATGAVIGKNDCRVGGLVGKQRTYRGRQSLTETSYSTGQVKAGTESQLGGFVGTSVSHSRYSDAYWDTTTSGTSQAAGKGNANGITGLTGSQLKSGLPAGFDSKIWAEDKSINNGLPYLIANPPPK